MYLLRTRSSVSGEGKPKFECSSRAVNVILFYDLFWALFVFGLPGETFFSGSITRTFSLDGLG